jgi:flavin reductase (DIM6/NTAB) family NADH-FMN oxidoreductase RutF
MTIDRDQFKEVAAKFASGVTVVTTADERGFHGVTVSSFCSLSLDPPLVLVCIDKSIQSHDLITAAPRFAVNILSREQTFYAEQFSGQTPLADPGFGRVPHRVSDSGLPLLDEAVAWIECEAWNSYDGGDHTIFIGEACWGDLGAEDDPLIYFDRAFTELSWG